MTHEDIESRGLVEAYVRSRLAGPDREAFEEHYFQCDQCFASVQAMQRFVESLAYAGRRGLLDPPAARFGWLMPAFAFSSALALILAAGLSFLAFVRLPDREARLQQALDKAKADRARIAELDQRAALDADQLNVPVAILEANRAADAPTSLRLDAQARTALIWIDVPRQPSGTQFALVISSPSLPSRTIHGLKRNPNGALALSLALSQIPDGSYAVRLYVDQPSAPLLAEYRLLVSRH